MVELTWQPVVSLHLNYLNPKQVKSKKKLLKHIYKMRGNIKKKRRKKKDKVDIEESNILKKKRKEKKQ